MGSVTGPKDEVRDEVRGEVGTRFWRAVLGVPLSAALSVHRR